MATTPTVEEVLAQTAIGNDFHRWAVQGGSITIETERLRPVLEEAYDPRMENWVALISWDDEDQSFWVC
jgi:hypothetical protein